MALSLIPDDTGWLVAKGVGQHQGPHSIDLYEMGGNLFLKFTVGSRNPGGGDDVDVQLSLDQVHLLMLGAAEGLVRLGDDRGRATLAAEQHRAGMKKPVQAGD